MRYYITITIIILGWAVSIPSAFSQEVSARIKFTSYLVNQRMFDESIYEADELLLKNLSHSQQDSLYYLKGWSLYNQKQLQESAGYLNEVTKNSTFYEKSRLFGIYNLTHLKNFESADSAISRYYPHTETGRNFKSFLNSGLYLLKRDIEGYKTTRQDIPSDYFGLSSELKRMDQISKELENRHKKSPVIAGILSGIIPGSGQIYSGKTGQGIAAFLLSSGLALVTIENYSKRGPERFETIFFGTVFSVFYIGNIWGATFSAKIANNEYNELTDKQILFNLHIPLRNIYD